MATNKPRITITLNPYVYATLKHMSELGGQPMSTIISELLDSVHEPFMRTVALLDAAAQAPKQVKDGLRQSFEAVERELYGTVGYTVAQMDWLTEQLGKPPAGDTVRPARAGRAVAPGGGASANSPGQTNKVGKHVGKAKVQAYADTNGIPPAELRSRKPNPHVVTRGSGLSQASKIKHLGEPKKGVKRG